MSTDSRFWSRWSHWIALVFVGGVVAATMLSAMPSTRGRMPPCHAHLRSLTHAIATYAYVNGGALPPAWIADASGRPMHSWRVLILPYLDQRALYDKYRFDEPWDGPHNRKLHDTVLEVFRCPDDSGGKKSTMTSYVAVVGPETFWPGAESVTFDQIRDSTTFTLLLVEVVDSGIHWMEPRDLDFATMSFRINDNKAKGISSHHPDVVYVAPADGSVRGVHKKKLRPETVRALLTRSGGERIGDDEF